MSQKKILNLPKLIGHRGVKDLCPENTLESINKAFDLGLNYIEIDVKISKDEVPILLHDDTLDRTTNATGLAINYDYNDLKKFDAGSFFYKKDTNINIPKLSEVLELCKKRKGNLNIELKPNKGFEKLNVKRIIEQTRKFNEFQIFYSSFNIDSFIEISECLSSANTGLIIDNFEYQSLDDIINISSKYNANVCGFNIDIITNEIIKKIKDNNFFVTVYSNKNINFKEALNCFNIGVDSVFTDDPRELLKFI